MATTTTEKKQIAARRSSALFGRENYKWMLIGLVIIVIGVLLMMGGKNTDPNTFDPKEVYSTRRITIAPILILLGLGVEIFAIFRRPDNDKRSS
jgi:uncharacterized membrane protein YidH (DUF202 family)